MNNIKTKLLMLSDTHALEGLSVPDVSVDVAIHCGDLTDESKMHEFHTTLALLRRINAPLKLVIAGNHEFTLDTPIFQKKAAQSQAVSRQLFTAASDDDGIVFLDEGIYHLSLQNGARLTVYASPFTPSLEADWGFQFKRGEHHDFAMIDQTVDVAITHGPPKGVLDLTSSKQRGGCEHLFAAVAKACPKMHCFAHIHEGWGAKLVAWRDDQPSENPSHFTDIDNGASSVGDRIGAHCEIVGIWRPSSPLARLSCFMKGGRLPSQCGIESLFSRGLGMKPTNEIWKLWPTKPITRHSSSFIVKYVLPRWQEGVNFRRLTTRSWSVWSVLGKPAWGSWVVW
ncbi:Metallo-dependent phosphatase-like protein [Podospora didyma]|uniref:Metallo-dependent phosphatase-like protein n=1 Tax=Podospora didyma TaxID=330526 RepID=A0AAE0U3P1_9PEZI|nr:Metallo-dependent phosphatase-like protein [Podospora didyma]